MLGISGYKILIFWGSFTCQTWKCHAQHLKLHLNLEIWFLLWDAFYCLSSAYMFLSNFVSDLQMSIIFTNCEMHICSPIVFLPTHIHTNLCRRNSVGSEQRKGTDYSLQLMCRRTALFPQLSITYLRGPLCHTIPAEPSATSVNQSQVLLPRLLRM